MSGVLAIGCLTAAGVVALMPASARTIRLRVGRAPTPARSGKRPQRPDGPESEEPGPAPRVRRALRPTAAVLCGVAVALLTGGWFGLAFGIAVGMATRYALGRLEPVEVRVERARSAADLPLAMDLLAAVLRAGSPVDAAVEAVADALGGPLGDRLARVARSLRLGAGSAEAWELLSDVPGAGRVVIAAVRSSASGGALAGAIARIADDLRADRTVSAEAAARRAGVLIVLPLGLCFLPAFVLAGLVPVIVAVLGGVL